MYVTNAVRCKGYKGPETLFSTLRGRIGHIGGPNFFAIYSYIHSAETSAAASLGRSGLDLIRTSWGFGLTSALRKEIENVQQARIRLQYIATARGDSRQIKACSPQEILGTTSSFPRACGLRAVCWCSDDSRQNPFIRLILMALSDGRRLNGPGRSYATSLHTTM